MIIISYLQIRKAFIRSLFSLLLCFCCLSAIAEPQQVQPSKGKGVFSTFLQKAKKRGNSYKTQLEIKYYEERLKKNPKDIALLETFGKFLKDHRYYEESIKIYNRLIKLTKNKKYQRDMAEIKGFQLFNEKASAFSKYIKQAQDYEGQGKIRKANEYYLKAQKIFPDRAEVDFGLAKTYGWLNSPQKAVGYYNELLKKAPNNIDFLEAYAKFLTENKDYKKAIETYNKLFALTKNKKYEIDLKEIVSIEKGATPRQASLELAQNLEHDKIFLDYINKARDYESHGEIIKANEYYKRANVRIPGRFEAKFGLAKTYGWLGQKKIAGSYYQELLSEAPKNPDLLAAYDKFLRESRGAKTSKPQAQKAFRNTPRQVVQSKSAVADKFSEYLKQAQIYETEGNAADSNEYYLKAHKVDPFRYEANFGLAKTYGWMHQDKLALHYYRELLKSTPNNADLLEAYAGYLRDSKDYSQSMQIYNRLLSQTGDEKYKANIAEIFFLQKDYQTSLKLYFELYDKNPNNPDIQNAIALSYFVSGDFEKSIDFYQKYFLQNQGSKSILPEAILNYGKSLFYTKNIQDAKDILEWYVKIYPKDAEGLSTLADVYAATKNLQCAMQLVNQAIVLEPENIKYKIQSAKIDIYAKNYAQAQCSLLQLAKIEPNNTDILESLGDISYNTGDFNQALCYFQRIIDLGVSDLKYQQKIEFKIAQSHHYNRDYVLAEALYKPFVCNPEYSNKAKIGIAEIKISQDKPLKARPLLNSVLANDPQNVQAKKNLAISFFSTGDNLTSISILKKLPKDDDDISDINYNLAKAYNEIERKDLALELLQDNPQDNAKILKGVIKMQTKPAIAPLYDFYYMNPNNGNVNAGRFQKAGANAYYYLKPNLRAVATGTTTQYSNLNNIVSTMGTLGSVGLEGKPTDHISFKSAIGYDVFTSNDNYPGNQNLILGNAIVKASPNDVVTFTGGYIRSLDEIDSYMSAAGVVPTTGPFANQLVGRIVDNKYIMAVAFKLPHKFYAYGGMNVGNKYGSYSPSNFYREIPAGFGKVVYSAPEERHINQTLIGYDFYYTGYNYDRSGFGGADLNYSPIGSDGQSPNPQTGFPGVGGYFSPTFFIANKFPITFKGSFKKTKLKYILSAFIGTQTIEGQIGLVGPSGGGPSNITTTPYYGYAVGLRYNEKGRVGWGVDYTFNNYMTVAQHMLKGFLLIRF